VWALILIDMRKFIRSDPCSYLVCSLICTRAGHGSVRAGFGPFGHPTRAPRVFEIPTRDSNANVENRRVSGGSARVFFVGLVGLVGRVGFLGDFQPTKT
jgi:hypothetical protein